MYKFKGDFRVWCLTIAIYIVGGIMTRGLQQDECVVKRIEDLRLKVQMRRKGLNTKQKLQKEKNDLLK